ncbi:MAG: chemotaxis-specific protein-glutamate methyltransferase CheB [Gemmatimonadota bacterium]
MIRVLVAEDSHAVRLFLISLLESDAEIQVVGQVADGQSAVDSVRLLRPDVITMDIHMPKLDGLEATARIMHEVPTPIVVVSSTVDARDVASSFDAMKAGALVALPKPGASSDRQAEYDRQNFVSTVKAMSKVKVVRRWSGAFNTVPPRGPPPGLKGTATSADFHHHFTADGSIGTPSSAARSSASARRLPAALIAIAASTGGPSALQRVLSALPGTFPAPIILVQHIARGFLPGFAAWLDSECVLRVKVAEALEPLLAGTVYVAPDDHHLGVSASRRVQRISGDPVNGFCPSASVLFQSAADAYGASLVSVILTGMGSDGVSGLRRVKARGGYVIAQDEATSLIYGMPGEALIAGVTDVMLPIDEIADHLLTLV